ncbi:hypothetical protein BDR22DRAFT_888633 [Usnea florida]
MSVERAIRYLKGTIDHGSTYGTDSALRGLENLGTLVLRPGSALQESEEVRFEVVQEVGNTRTEGGHLVLWSSLRKEEQWEMHHRFQKDGVKIKQDEKSSSFQIWSFRVRLELMQERTTFGPLGSVMHEAKRSAKTLKDFTQVVRSLRLYHPLDPRRPSSTHLGPIDFCQRRSLIFPQRRCPDFGSCGLARILPQWPGQLNHHGRFSTPIRGSLGIRGYPNLTNTMAASQEHVYVYPDPTMFVLNALPPQQDSPLNIPTAKVRTLHEGLHTGFQVDLSHQKVGSRSSWTPYSKYSWLFEQLVHLNMNTMKSVSTLISNTHALQTSNCDHIPLRELDAVAVDGKAALGSTDRQLAFSTDRSSIPFMTATTPPFAIDPILLELERLATTPIPVVSASVFRIFEASEPEYRTWYEELAGPDYQRTMCRIVISNIMETFLTANFEIVHVPSATERLAPYEKLIGYETVILDLEAAKPEQRPPLLYLPIQVGIVRHFSIANMTMESVSINSVPVSHRLNPRELTHCSWGDGRLHAATRTCPSVIEYAGVQVWTAICARRSKILYSGPAFESLKALFASMLETVLGPCIYYDRGNFLFLEFRPNDEVNPIKRNQAPFYNPEDEDD